MTKAQQIVDKWVKELGLGFHIDTRGEDYVADDGSQALTARQIERYDADMASLFGLCDDPYAIAVEAMEPLMTQEA